MQRLGNVIKSLPAFIILPTFVFRPRLFAWYYSFVKYVIPSSSAEAVDTINKMRTSKTEIVILQHFITIEKDA